MEIAIQFKVPKCENNKDFIRRHTVAQNGHKRKRLKAMKSVKRFLVLVVLCDTLGVPQANADRIELACKASNLEAASNALCLCIQKAADLELTREDQRLAAKFFKKPDLAQKIRQSDDPHKEQFWERYTTFMEYATEVCS
jgi:hypothetical protein